MSLKNVRTISVSLNIIDYGRRLRSTKNVGKDVQGSSCATAIDCEALCDHDRVIAGIQCSDDEWTSRCLQEEQGLAGIAHRFADTH